MAPSTSQRALSIAAVYAHPDDGEFFAAGALARWASEGHRIYAICATNGDLGTKRRDVTREEVARTRADELAAAMRTIGGEPPILLGYADGTLREHASSLRERLVRLYRELALDRIVTFDPWKQYEVHPDHMEIGRAASEAAAFSCFPLHHREHLQGGLEPKQPAEVWFMMPSDRRPNRIVDIEPTFDTKVKSLLCHASQMEMLAPWFVPGADPTRTDPEQRRAIEQGARAFLHHMARGAARWTRKVKLAEAYYALRVGPGHFEDFASTFKKPTRDAEILR